MATTDRFEHDARAWQRPGLVLFAVAWGANHFVPLLLVYRARLALDAAQLALLFGMYALGLVPGLLLAGPLSDRRGRRAVTLPAACVALAASLVLGAGGGSFGALLLGRLLYGLGAGGAMSAGATWVVELSETARDAAPGAGARRATIALSAGFGLGPLVSGPIAQVLPAPTLLPYAIHAALLGGLVLAARGAPDAGNRAPPGPLLRIELDRAGWRSFARGVVPMAPFVYGFPAIAVAALPGMLADSLGRAPMVYTGLIAGMTLGAGVVVQPVTRRLEPVIGSRLGLLVGAAGLVLAALAVARQLAALLLVVAPILGAGYGMAMTGGFQAVQRLARPDARGGITGLYYVLTYVGFVAPYLLALAARVAAPGLPLAVTAGLSVAAALALPRGSGGPRTRPRSR
ncbi:MAG TPA: MFS transporter [Kofleriaceae bacterium]|nr:MFS transporter [Kofleriaceae bacterium]